MINDHLRMRSRTWRSKTTPCWRRTMASKDGDLLESSSHSEGEHFTMRAINMLWHIYASAQYWGHCSREVFLSIVEIWLGRELVLRRITQNGRMDVYLRDSNDCASGCFDCCLVDRISRDPQTERIEPIHELKIQPTDIVGVSNPWNRIIREWYGVHRSFNIGRASTCDSKRWSHVANRDSSVISSLGPRLMVV